jgi:hypothetical protein
VGGPRERLAMLGAGALPVVAVHFSGPVTSESAHGTIPADPIDLGFAMAASPSIVQFVGGTPGDATANSPRMQAITLGTNPAFTLPASNLRRGCAAWCPVPGQATDVTGGRLGTGVLNGRVSCRATTARLGLRQGSGILDLAIPPRIPSFA